MAYRAVLDSINISFVCGKIELQLALLARYIDK
jgi:hypothetical protein